MDLNQLKDILDLVREHELSEFEIEHEGLRLKVRKDCAAAVVALAVSLPIEEILALTCPMMDLVEATNQVALVSGLQQGEALAKTVPQTSRRGAKSTEASPQSAATATL